VFDLVLTWLRVSVESVFAQVLSGWRNGYEDDEFHPRIGQIDDAVQWHHDWTWDWVCASVTALYRLSRTAIRLGRGRLTFVCVGLQLVLVPMRLELRADD